MQNRKSDINWLKMYVNILMVIGTQQPILTN